MGTNFKNLKSRPNFGKYTKMTLCLNRKQFGEIVVYFLRKKNCFGFWVCVRIWCQSNCHVSKDFGEVILVKTTI